MNKTALSSALQFLDPWLAYRTDHTELTGLSVAIQYHSETIFSGAYGLADTTQKRPLKTVHQFATASQSKLFTATAILKLVAEGKIRLDDPVCQYLPWLKEQSDARLREITSRQLLLHRSGLLREGSNADHWRFVKPFPDIDQLRKTIADGLVFDPNTKTKYSNLGFALLGQVVEAVTGQSYQSYVMQHIVEPLNLKQTSFGHTPELAGKIPTGYGPVHRGVRPLLVHDQPPNTFAPVTGIYATPADMCRFAAAHFFGDESIIDDLSKKEMQRSQDIILQGYDAGRQLGLGVEILQLGNRRIIGHGGHSGGHLTATYFDPYDHLAVSVMSNCRDAPSSEIACGIISALDFFGEHATRPAAEHIDRLNVRLHNYLNTIQIVATDGKIVAIDPDDWNPFSFSEELSYQGADMLAIVTEGSFFNEGEDIRYSFNKNRLQSVTYAGITLLPD